MKLKEKGPIIRPVLQRLQQGDKYGALDADYDHFESASSTKTNGYNAFFNIHFDQFSTKTLSTPLSPTNEFSNQAINDKNRKDSGEFPWPQNLHLRPRSQSTHSSVYMSIIFCLFSAPLRTKPRIRYSVNVLHYSDSTHLVCHFVELDVSIPLESFSISISICRHSAKLHLGLMISPWRAWTR